VGRDPARCDLAPDYRWRVSHRVACGKRTVNARPPAAARTLLTVVVFAGLTFQQVARLAVHEPAPWLGLIERVGIYAWVLWVASAPR
jgi:hypothetical protein